MTAPEPAVTFDAFYRAEQAMLLRYFRRRVGPEAAPDLVQDAFTRMFRSGAFDRIDYPRPYLLRTARNLVFERARRKAREGGAGHHPAQLMQRASSGHRLEQRAHQGLGHAWHGRRRDG